MKLTKIACILSMGLALVGCTDLEEELTNEVPTELLESEEPSIDRVESFITTSYSHMHHRNFLSREMAQALLFRSDMMAIGRTGVQERIDHDDFTVESDNGLINTYWPKVYQIIRSANDAMGEVARLNADPNDAVVNEAAGRARFARAFAYFHLVRQFGAIPYLDENTTIEELSSITRLPVENVYDNIIADFEFAKQWLPDTQASRAIPAKSAASSFLALVYLTREEWQMAYDEATEVIANEGTYNLGLEPDFQDLYDSVKIDASLEPIFVLDFTGVSDGDQGRDYQAAFTGGRGNEEYGFEGWSVQVPSAKVFTEWDAADYRRAVTFDDTMIIGGVEVSYENYVAANERSVNRPHVAKYTRMASKTPTQDGNGRGSNSNYCMMRYAEVLMIAAEAANELGNSGDAETYLNRVLARARSGGVTNGFVASTSPADVSGLSQTDFTDRIMEERRMEFAYEFKRWYDIARRRLGNVAFDATTGLESEVSTEDGVGPGEKFFDPAKDYLFPIPQSEINLAPTLLPNNPGY